MSFQITILYQDIDLVAVHKPAGWKVHRDSYDGPRSQAVLQFVRKQTGRWVYPVHRLDRPVSGVLLFAFSPETAGRMALYFRDRKVRKTYLAITRGYVAPAGSIDYPLTGQAYAPKSGQARKAAVTDYERLATAELPVSVGRYATCRTSLVAVYPRSGRMHQIRRHFHHVSHPIIGDTAYGDARYNRFFRNHFECHCLLLAAVEIQLPHPRNGAPLHVIAPLDRSFDDLVGKMGWARQIPERWRCLHG